MRARRRPPCWFDPPPNAILPRHLQTPSHPTPVSRRSALLRPCLVRPSFRGTTGFGSAQRRNHNLMMCYWNCRVTPTNLQPTPTSPLPLPPLHLPLPHPPSSSASSPLSAAAAPCPVGGGAPPFWSGIRDHTSTGTHPHHIIVLTTHAMVPLSTTPSKLFPSCVHPPSMPPGCVDCTDESAAPMSPLLR